MSEVIRIANCSGFYGDRLAAAIEMVKGGSIDVLTGLSAAREITIYCISERAALSFKKANFKFVYIASRPNENALIKSIKKRHF